MNKVWKEQMMGQNSSRNQNINNFKKNNSIIWTGQSNRIYQPFTGNFNFLFYIMLYSDGKETAANIYNDSNLR